MTKAQKLAALEKTLAQELKGAEYFDARVLLKQFIAGFKIKAFHAKAKGLEKLWYKIIAIPLFFDGFIRDVRVNSTSGKKLFGAYSVKDKYFGLSTLTGTLIRVKQAEPINTKEFTHPAYGLISKEKVMLAHQICEVLNDYDKGHC